MRLELCGLTKRYGLQPALDDVSLLLPDFRVLAVIGPSGGGKSSLLRILAGLDFPDSGKVAIDGERLVYEEEWLRCWRRQIGTVFQSFNLFPHLTALQNIMLPLEKVHGHSPKHAREEAEAILSRFRLAEHAGKKPAQLSGGQQQRVAIARAVAIRPRALLFDEPTSALDPEMTAEVLDLITELRDEGRDLILVTHEIGFARRIADHGVFIAQGKIEATGSVPELLTHPPQMIVQKFLERLLRT
jgi:polar amino acid transport system ATP-binding protein